jgi:hypothetical protein
LATISVRGSALPSSFHCAGSRSVGNSGAVGQDDRTVLGFQRVSSMARTACGSGDNRCTGRGPGGAHLFEGIGGRGRSAGQLKPQELGRHLHESAHGFGGPAVVGGGKACRLLEHRAVEIGMRGGAVDDADGGPVKVHLLGHKGGKGGVDALPHLGAGGDDRHALGVDQHIGGQRLSARAGFQRVRIGAVVGIGAEGRPPGDGGNADQEGAAGNGADA